MMFIYKKNQLRACLSSSFCVRAAFAGFALVACLSGLLPTGEMHIARGISVFNRPAMFAANSPKILASPLVSTGIVISQIYGGAGCGTAGCSTYQNDYIELYNLSNAPVTITAGSVQYAAATGTAWQVTALPAALTINPGRYYLIAESFGANGVNPLLAPDTTGTIAMSATAAKIALVGSTTALSGACPASANIIDFVGYGATANCAEPGPANNTANNAPVPSTTTADVRKNQGVQDTDLNSADFTAATPNPRNSQLAPTAAAVSIAGRVTAGGRGAANARIEMTDRRGAVRTVVTNAFGYFTISDVPAGAIYVIRVSAKRYSFAPQIISVTDSVSGLNLTALQE